MTVQATGSAPLSYQWRRNGVNVPGANSSTFTIATFQPTDSGDYSVAVADVTGAVNSDIAQVRAAKLSDLPFTDAMGGQNRITDSNGTGRGSNVDATKEPGEPNHASKPGSHSVWLTWQAPLLGGVAKFDTAGSSFDTLLAVYTGDSVANLTLVAANDDVSNCDDPASGFHTSRVKFNAQGGTVYHIAVDGLGGAAGDIVLNWDVNVFEGLLTVLNILPPVTLGLPGDNLTLSVNPQSLVSYQWYLDCQPIPGATANLLRINNLQASKVGDYAVHVKDLLGVETVSDSANVQINITDGRAVNVAALDKFPETAGATKDPGEPNHCGETGRASVWYAYQPPASGMLILDTDGSSFATVLAVYTGPGTDFASLVPVTCDKTSGSTAKTCRVVFPVRKDTVYYIAVDGVGGASGTAELNYNLGVAPVFTLLPVSRTVTPGDIVTLSTTASGVPAPLYQWYFGQNPISGATNASLTITNFQYFYQGDYKVVASNFADSTVSAPATLLLNSPLRLDSFHAINDATSMRLVGQSDGSYIIQYSPNLQDWTSLATNTVPNGIWAFVDTNAHASSGFYRAVSR
ncbi:MAG: hypothetical protein DME24_09150 [Verrucomicrobia bacterium]|nr:MAG: hypothetical protein DME24_09150 [Verrucomicrobiota bacterium]